MVLPSVCCLPCGVNAGFITVVDGGRWWSGSLSPPKSGYGRKSVVVDGEKFFHLNWFSGIVFWLIDVLLLCFGETHSALRRVVMAGSLW